jgi:hypothetical protein
MGRPRKDGTPASRPVKSEQIEKLVLEGYEITHRGMPESDYTGVSYAERLGEVKSVFNRLVEELGLQVGKQKEGV